jgi:hypothetical protein
MAQITGGKITYARTIQPAQYESKRAEVELTFVLAEGEDLGNTLDDVARKVKTKALQMVGLKSRDD